MNRCLTASAITHLASSRTQRNAVLTLSPNRFHATNQPAKRLPESKLLSGLMSAFSNSLPWLSVARAWLCESLNLAHFATRRIGSRSDQRPQQSEAGRSKAHRSRLFRIEIKLQDREAQAPPSSCSCSARAYQQALTLFLLLQLKFYPRSFNASPALRLF